MLDGSRGHVSADVTAAPGTVEIVVLEVAAALSALESRLTPNQIRALVAEMGLSLPPELEQQQAFTASVTAAQTAAGDLPDSIGKLLEAIRAEDLGRILETGAILLRDTAEVVSAFRTMGAELEAVSGALPGVDPADVVAFAKALAERLLEQAVVDYLLEIRPRLGRALALAGVVVVVAEPGNPADPTKPAYVSRRLQLQRVPEWLASPPEVLKSLYGWGTDQFDGPLLLGRVADVLFTLGIPTVVEPPGTLRPTSVAIPGLETRTFAGPPPGLEAHLRYSLAREVRLEYEFHPAGWAVEFLISAGLEAGVRAQLLPVAELRVLPPAGVVSGGGAIGIKGDAGEAGRAFQLFGLPGGSRLEARRARVAVGAEFSWDPSANRAQGEFVVNAEIADGRVVLTLAGADGFLASVLPTGALELPIDVAGGWSPSRGVYVSGGGGLALELPVHLQLGPATLQGLSLAVVADTQGLRLDARIAGAVGLGPFTASVKGVGVGATLTLQPGNLGPVDLVVAFRPPTGLGLAVNAGPVRGGGFIDYDEPAGRYSGLLDLKIGTIGITAIGLLDTKLPSGSGFALLVALRAEFPPVQLGFGIALSAVGGLLGLNRRLDVDALRQRFASGAVGRILAPEDPVRNAPLLLAELGTVFPIVEGTTVVGPTLQLSWAELVRLDLGIFLELPGPTKIVLLGSARAAIENPAGGSPYLQIRLDILGVLDFPKRALEFDAVLVDSQLLEVFELTGGAAFRLSWGDQPYVVLSIGGFHPAYNPAPLAFPSSLTRVAMTRGRPTDLIYLRFEGYFAITTNTLQFGAAVQLIVNAGPITAEGFLAFDALIRFQPFYFEFSFEASVRVKFKGLTLAGVRVTGVLSGPGPVTFTGELCFQILFFEICWNATFTLGSSTPPPVEAVVSALPALGDELRKPSNLSTPAATDAFVALSAPGATLPVLPPVGPLAWAQKRAPLDLLLQRFEGAPLERHETISASGPAVSRPARDWFAPGSFAELSDSDALNRRGLERLQGGVEIGGAADIASSPVAHVVEVQQYRIVSRTPTAPKCVPGAPGAAWLQAAINRREGVEGPPPGALLVTLHDETWTVSTVAGEHVAAGLSESQAHQLASEGELVATAAEDRVPAMSF